MSRNLKSPHAKDLECAGRAQRRRRFRCRIIGGVWGGVRECVGVGVCEFRMSRLYVCSSLLLTHSHTHAPTHIDSPSQVFPAVSCAFVLPSPGYAVTATRQSRNLVIRRLSGLVSLLGRCPNREIPAHARGGARGERTERVGGNDEIPGLTPFWLFAFVLAFRPAPGYRLRRRAERSGSTGDLGCLAMY